ncbi:MAG: NAD(P)-binding domain-containing protein, partial [Nocardioidaceae bacterium]
GAATTEAPALAGKQAFVVGGGNSAGQAALHLAKYADRVTLLVRADSLAASMSDYLIREIDLARNLDVRHGVEVVGGSGTGDWSGWTCGSAGPAPSRRSGPRRCSC